MKVRIKKNKDLDEPYDCIPDEQDILICEDGYIYCGDTSHDPIDRGEWDDWRGAYEEDI